MGQQLPMEGQESRRKILGSGMQSCIFYARLETEGERRTEERGGGGAACIVLERTTQAGLAQAEPGQQESQELVEEVVTAQKRDDRRLPHPKLREQGEDFRAAAVGHPFP